MNKTLNYIIVALTLLVLAGLASARWFDTEQLKSHRVYTLNPGILTLATETVATFASEEEFSLSGPDELIIESKDSVNPLWQEEVIQQTTLGPGKYILDSKKGSDVKVLLSEPVTFKNSFKGQMEAVIIYYLLAVAGFFLYFVAIEVFWNKSEDEN